MMSKGAFLPLVLCLVFRVTSVSAQLPESLSIRNKSVPQLLGEKTVGGSFSSMSPIPKFQFFSQTKNKLPLKVQPDFFEIVPIKPTAFFCKLEVILEKRNGIPIKFRIGDIDKVDQLEGKFFR
jgi:hypothetical protein